MRLRRTADVTLDMLAVLVLGVAALLVLYDWPSVAALRTGLGLPFMLLGVGYAAACAIYAHERPDGATALLLSLAFSVAIIVLTALVLYAAGIAFTGKAILSAELVVTVVLAVIAVLRRGRSGTGAGLTAAWRGRIPLTLAAACMVPIGVFAGLIVVLSTPLPNSHVAGYSALWAVRGVGPSIDAGVSSSQLTPMTYRIEVIPAHGPPTISTLTLGPGQRWTRSIAIARPSLQPVVVKLFRSTEPTRAYRQITLAP